MAEQKETTPRNVPASPPPLGAPSLLEHLVHNQANAALLLLLAAVTAFGCANSTMMVTASHTLAEMYHALWHFDVGVAVHQITITQSLHVWINDGLMVIFFFLAGLEIKRELLVGELASLKKAALPIGAAVGGMAVPALIYVALNAGTPAVSGWGIPMATDIAFAVGVLGLLSGRVPLALSTFLMALAIVDDLGAVLVIAVFYTETISTDLLLTGLVLLGISYTLGLFGVRNSLVYAGLFAFIWLTFLQSGVHATVAGVLFAFTIPANAVYESPLFVKRLNELLQRFDDAEDYALKWQVNEAQQRLIASIQQECKHVEAPLQRILRQLHPFSAFIIMPLFALANAGVQIDFSQLGELFSSRVTLGVMLGLLVGKQLGITGFAWALVRAGWAELPGGVSWKQLYAVSILGSIGFTMSLFITELAFKPHPATADAAHEAPGVVHLEPEADDSHAATGSGNERVNAEAKLGVLSASLIAGIGGVLLLHRVMPPADRSRKESHA